MNSTSTSTLFDLHLELTLDLRPAPQAPPDSRFRLSVCAFTRAAIDIGTPDASETSSADGTGGGANCVIVAESLQAFNGALSHLHPDNGRVNEYIFGTLRWDATLAAVAPLAVDDEAVCEAFLEAAALLVRPGFYDGRFRQALLGGTGGGGGGGGSALGAIAVALRQHREGSDVVEHRGLSFLHDLLSVDGSLDIAAACFDAKVGNCLM